MSYKLFQINPVVNSGSTGRIAQEIRQIAIAASWKSYIAYGRNNQSYRNSELSNSIYIIQLCESLISTF